MPEEQDDHVRRDEAAAVLRHLADTAPPERDATWKRRFTGALRELAQAGAELGYEKRVEEERAGPAQVDYFTFRSMLAEGFHTAFRKATDSAYAPAVHALIREMRREDWREVISFTADPLWNMLRDGGMPEASTHGTSDLPADESTVRLKNLAELILAHLQGQEENERRERAVKSLVGQVLNLGRSIGWDKRVAVERERRE